MKKSPASLVRKSYNKIADQFAASRLNLKWSDLKMMKNYSKCANGMLGGCSLGGNWTNISDITCSSMEKFTDVPFKKGGHRSDRSQCQGEIGVSAYCCVWWKAYDDDRLQAESEIDKIIRSGTIY